MQTLPLAEQRAAPARSLIGASAASASAEVVVVGFVVDEDVLGSSSMPRGQIERAGRDGGSVLARRGRQNKLPPHTRQNPRSALGEDRYQDERGRAESGTRSLRRRAGHGGMVAAGAPALRAMAGDDAAQGAANAE